LKAFYHGIFEYCYIQRGGGLFKVMKLFILLPGLVLGSHEIHTDYKKVFEKKRIIDLYCKYWHQINKYPCGVIYRGHWMSVGSILSLLNELNKIIIMWAPGEHNIVLFNSFNKFSIKPTLIGALVYVIKVLYRGSKNIL
jgi:hypothetical protein